MVGEDLRQQRRPDLDEALSKQVREYRDWRGRGGIEAVVTMVIVSNSVVVVVVMGTVVAILGLGGHHT